jgi:hypothetical protein
VDYYADFEKASKDTSLNESNLGMSMLKNMGWTSGTGLGADRYGGEREGEGGGEEREERGYVDPSGSPHPPHCVWCVLCVQVGHRRADPRRGTDRQGEALALRSS